MRPVSTDFLAALTGAHGMVTSCRIVGHGPSPALGVAVPIISGTVNLDGTATIRGSLDLVLAGSWPTDAAVLAGGQSAGTATMVHPYGVQIQVSRGIRYGNGSLELVKLGVFVVQTATQDGLRSSPEIHITGQDRAALVIEASAYEAVQFPASTSWADMVAAVLTGAHSLLTAQFDFDATTSIGVDLLLEENGDRWKFLTDAAAGIAKVAWFDADGICQIAAPPDPGLPVWTVAAGRRGVMVGSARSLQRDGQFNGVLALGEAASDSSPSRGLAFDTGSATAWGDDYGRRLKVISSSLFTDDTVAAAAAEAQLRLTAGLPYQLDLSAVPNPAMEPWDVVRVVHSGADSELHYVDRVSVPLSADGAVTLATRETSTVIVNV